MGFVMSEPIIEIDEYGTKVWYLNGKLHRKDGPAIEYANGYKEWWFNGLRHREDGPAREYIDGDKEWWLNSRQYSKEDYTLMLFFGVKDV